MKNKIVTILNAGGVAVLLTDTIYGIVARALDKKAVERIYEVKGRKNTKPLIILISSIESIKLFGVELPIGTEKILKKVWPGPVSVILSCQSKKFQYLHRKTQTLAFRIPEKKSLLEIINQTGPLVAPSANPEGLTPSKNVTMAKHYFAERVDLYVSGGRPKISPSTVVKLEKGKMVVLREGRKKIILI